MITTTYNALGTEVTYVGFDSTTIREIVATVRADGNFGPVTFRFNNGGEDVHAFVVGEDFEQLLAARSIGTAYWQTFRRKYKPGKEARS